MSINLQQFRTASLGNVARLETSTSRDALNLKGTSGLGRAVEWIREGLGLRTERNARTMTTFLAALKAEFGRDIGAIVENGLSRDLKSGKTPLSSRVCHQVIGQAESLRREFETVQREFSPEGAKFELAALRVRQKSEHPAALAVLTEKDGDDAQRLRRDIASGLSKAQEGRDRPLSEEDALAVVSDIMTHAVTRRANALLLKEVLDVESKSELRSYVSTLTSELGVREFIDGFGDTNSRIMSDFIQFSTDKKDKVLTREEMCQLLPAALRLFLKEKISLQHLGEMQSLTADLELMSHIAKKFTSKIALGDDVSVGRLAKLCVDTTKKLDLSESTTVGIALTLMESCRKLYEDIKSEALKNAVLTALRDVRIASARFSSHPIKELGEAIKYQSSILALALKEARNRLDAAEQNDGEDLQLAARATRSLKQLSEADEDVRHAVLDMTDLQNRYITALGGSVEHATIDFIAARDTVAAMRRDVEALVGEASGTEVQAFISARMRDITSDMIKRAMNILGEPPVPFVAISVGSASRGEASPYSDIEFAFLLKEQKTKAAVDYLTKLSQLVELQVLELGESGSLETFTGIHWDEGRNTPSDNPAKFIGTASDLIAANLLMLRDGRPEEIMLLAMFMGPEYLCGSLDDEDGFALVQDLQQKIHEHFGRQSAFGEATVGAILGPALAADGASIAQVSKNVTADRVNVKDISRLPMLMLEGLALEHGLILDNLGGAANSSVMRIDALVKKDVLSRSDAEVLKTAIQELANARLKATLMAGCDNNTVHLTRKEDQTGYVDESLREVIRSLIPFEQRIEQQKAARSAVH